MCKVFRERKRVIMTCFRIILAALLLAAGLAAEELPDTTGEETATGIPQDSTEKRTDAAREWPDATEIVRRADQHVRGASSRAVLTMEIARPDWSREMGLEFWSKDSDRALILITSPARDRGTTFLLRNEEVWNYRPDIDRVIKLPPSMMSQSWMGTDFTNDDLVKESSIVEDYHHEIVGDTTLAVDTTGGGGNTPSGDTTRTGVTAISADSTPDGNIAPAIDSTLAADTILAGRPAWEIRLTPKPEAAVVWGEVRLWVGKEHDLQLHAEYYDEDGELVNVMEMSRIREMGGRLLPTVMVMRPVDEEGKWTRMVYQDIEFDIEIEDSFFSQQNMKRIRP